MQRAFFIFLLPSERESVIWEFRQIVDQGWLQKTYFVMPPICGHYAAQKWERAQLACKKFIELDMPPPDHRGCIFQIMSRKGELSVQPLMFLSGIGEPEVKKLFQRVFECAGQTMDFDPKIEIALPQDHPDFIHPYDRAE